METATQDPFNSNEDRKEDPSREMPQNQGPKGDHRRKLVSYVNMSIQKYFSIS